MPQAWREHWGSDIEHDLDAQERRDRLVQSLGNLTLVKGNFNSLLSNRPWTDTEASERGLGKDGKRDFLLKHSQLKLNADLVAEHAQSWSEEDILRRGDELVAGITKIWPRPDGSSGELAAPATTIVDDSTPAPSVDAEEAPAGGSAAGAAFARPAGRVVTHTGKYRALWTWLIDQDRSEIRLTFADVEQILGLPVPNSARVYMAH